MTTEERPLSYWVSLARMGFENDLNRIIDDLEISRTELARRVNASPAYVSKVLNGSTGNFTLATMTKWARAIGAVVQIRLVKDGKEVVRVVDYETASALDDAEVQRDLPHSEGERLAGGRVLTFPVAESADSYRSLGRQAILLSSVSGGR